MSVGDPPSTYIMPRTPPLPQLAPTSSHVSSHHLPLHHTHHLPPRVRSLEQRKQGHLDYSTDSTISTAVSLDLWSPSLIRRPYAVLWDHHTPTTIGLGTLGPPLTHYTPCTPPNTPHIHHTLMPPPRPHLNKTLVSPIHCLKLPPPETCKCVSHVHINATKTGESYKSQ